ncbi:MAG: GTP-binding protein [Methanomassiliicoccales archaeon]|nr:MAG: GTP-binding protein [Methanomassiliicoccales archaeon]
MPFKKKVVMLGNSSVGKTSLVRRFVFDQFEDSYITTIGSKTTAKVLKIQKGGKEVVLTLVVWDVMGRIGYIGAHSRMFKGADGALLVTDLTRKETLDSLERYWIPLLWGVVDNVPLIFISNKSDLVDEMAFDPDDLERIASKYNMGIKEELPSHLFTSYLTSAKTGENVENAFESLGHLLLSKKTPWDPVKELYKNLLAKGNLRQRDTRTPIGATDALIVDFCKGFDDEKLAMLMLRQEIIRAGLDINEPSKEGLLRLVEFLADAENEYKTDENVIMSRERRLSLARGVRE